MNTPTKFSTAKQLHDDWAAQKDLLLSEQTLDLRARYGRITSTDGDRPRQVRVFGSIGDNPTRSPLASGAVALGAVAAGVLAAPSVAVAAAVIGVIAVGKTAYDIVKRKQYNAAIGGDGEIRNILERAGDAGDAVLDLEKLDWMARKQERPDGWLQNLNVAAARQINIMATTTPAVMFGALVIAEGSPLVGAAMISAAMAINAVAVGKEMAKNTAEGLREVAQRATERVSPFAVNLAARRGVISQEQRERMDQSIVNPIPRRR